MTGEGLALDLPMLIPSPATANSKPSASISPLHFSILNLHRRILTSSHQQKHDNNHSTQGWG